MRSVKIILAILSLFLVPHGLAANQFQLAGEQKQPLLDGGFWQVGPALSQQLNDEQLAEEVGHFKDLGMDLILIQYTASQYDHDADTYYAYVRGTGMSVHPGLEEKDPIQAIMDAAEKEGVRVILGGLLMPMPRFENYQENLDIWTSQETRDYRRAVIEKYKDYDCFVGWYTPNEPNPDRLAQNNADPQLMIDATKEMTEFVKNVHPDLGIVKSIGLYHEPVDGDLRLASMDYLDNFWRPWVSQLDAVDAWMVIDGVGTQLSTLDHTDKAQAWAADLAHEFGKKFWVDVENAHMGGENYPMTIEELKASLKVAAKHGSTLVTFDYAHYMSKLSPKEKARQLHEDYAAYREELLQKNKEDEEDGGADSEE